MKAEWSKGWKARRKEGKEKEDKSNNQPREGRKEGRFRKAKELRKERIIAGKKAKNKEQTNKKMKIRNKMKNTKKEEKNDEGKASGSCKEEVKRI